MKNSINQKLLTLALTALSVFSLNAQNNQNDKINYDRPYDKAGINVRI